MELLQNNSTTVPALSKRETEICEMLKDGCTYKQMGINLQISTETVRKHCTHIYSKMGAKNRAHLLLILGHLANLMVQAFLFFADSDFADSLMDAVF